MQRGLFPPAAAVGSVLAHRHVRVGHPEDASASRDLLPSEVARIAVPIPALVVMANEGQDRPQLRERAENAGTELRVLLDASELRHGQGLRLWFQYWIRS